ncbi:MAG: biotin transporter BioY [Clostridia bacterium]|nr:biotin transporter BioY [Clostridia bacterium]
MIYIALFAVIIAVCSWISIPSSVPFTLQTFAIASALLFLGGLDALLSVLLYVLLGAVGLPVFSSFTGGVAVLMGPTGGYILGFVVMALVYWLMTSVFKDKLITKIIAITVGMIFCYLSGSLYYVFIGSNGDFIQGFITALSACVLPFIIGDIIKITLAFLLVLRLSKILKRR